MAAAVALGVAISGCGGGTGVRTSNAAHAVASRAAARAPAAAGPTTAQLARASTTHELPTPPGRQTVTGGWRTAVQAVDVFATAYINWTATTVAGRLRELARVSVGQARAAVDQQASEVAADTELRAGGLANAGTVEAIGPVAGHVRRYAVVTRETTTASRSDAYQGLRPAWHVALASVTRTTHGLWVLSGWQPEN